MKLNILLAFGIAGLADGAGAGWIDFPIGVTPDNRVIEAVVTAEDFDIDSKKVRVLLVCDPEAVDGLKTEFGTAIEQLSWAAISILGTAQTEFPPKGAAYQGEHAETHYVWRWIGMHAPDHVIDLRSGDGQQLLTALGTEKPAGAGSIPGVQAGPEQKTASVLAGLSRELSPARQELQKRAARSPVEIAEALSKHYPGKVSQIAYIPALALVGRMRTGELTGNAEHLEFARQGLEKWLEKEPTTPEQTSGPYVAGHLMFSEFARLTGDERAWNQVLAAGKLGLDPAGEPLTVMPGHSEMSDAVFMGCPLLAEAGKHSGDERYFAACHNQMRSIQNWCLREDGLYQHSPLDQAAWGRGNGFPALGLALSLTDLPPDFEGHQEILDSLTSHLAALTKHQDRSGMFHEVIDRPESYREFTATSMITFAMLRGLRQGWLDRETFEPVADRAWEAIKLRIAMDGAGLVDVCTGTGKQNDLRAYYERAAILGRDDRGGAMALMVSTERAFWERERPK